jgi:hypothetical protein
MEELINAYVDECKTCPYADQAQAMGGQNLLSGIGPRLQDDVLAGDSTNISGTHLLWRLLRFISPTEISLIAITEQKLRELSIKKDPTLNYRSLFAKVKLESADLRDKLPKEWVYRHLSLIVANAVIGDDHFYSTHIPPIIQTEIMQLYKKHTTRQTTWSEMLTSMHEVLDVYDDCIKLSKWCPIMNKPRTKEMEEVLKVNQTLIAQVNKLENKINNLEQNPNTTNT